MHDIRNIRAAPDEFRAKLLRRGVDPDVTGLLALDEQRRSLLARLNEMRRERNAESKRIAAAKKSAADTTQLEAGMRELGGSIKTAEGELAALDSRLHDLLAALPNLPDDSVPDGSDAADNVVVRSWGEQPNFDFTPRDHLEVANRLGILDFNRGGKVTGSGFPVWAGAGAQLERALINHMLELHTAEHGYREMMTPFLANYSSMFGSGQIPKLEADMYRCSRSGKDEGGEELFLIPTSEVTLINLHRDEVLSESDMPLKYAAYSPCFRREAGAYGHLTRGFLRVHQFNKVELVRFEKPEDSAAALEELVRHAEAVLQGLELRYRVVKLCTGDIGFNAALCYDLEVWAPGEGRWLEVSSCSNCTDFQARRAKIRFRRAGGGVEFVHTLNGSGLATSRLMVALLETYQTEEGSLVVPPVLRNLMGGKTVITA